MAFHLSPLPYPSNALEPYIDAATMEIHHGKHHQAYVNNLNAAIQGSEIEEDSLEKIVSGIHHRVPENIRTAVRNNAGGHLNHMMFWELLTPKGPKEPVGALKEAIIKTFQSIDHFKEVFETAGKGRFGSGWVWLVVSNGHLEVMSTANQDNPLMDGKKPVIGVDVWEHAYYLKYQNKRPDYLTAVWHVLNWDQAEKNYQKAIA
jgi:Fe-Mn family superoxide dismutase